jgi:hypothetical protein
MTVGIHLLMICLLMEEVGKKLNSKYFIKDEYSDLHKVEGGWRSCLRRSTLLSKIQVNLYLQVHLIICHKKFYEICKLKDIISSYVIVIKTTECHSTHKNHLYGALRWSL